MSELHRTANKIAMATRDVETQTVQLGSEWSTDRVNGESGAKSNAGYSYQFIVRYCESYPVPSGSLHCYH